MTDIDCNNILHRDVFTIPAGSADKDFDNKLKKINSISLNNSILDTFVEVYNDKTLQHEIAVLIKKQGQMDDTGGYLVDPHWAASFKQEIFYCMACISHNNSFSHFFLHHRPLSESLSFKH